MLLDTAGNIVNDALLELGLVDAALADPYSSVEQNVVALRAYLKALGRELVQMRSWSHLQQEATITTANGTAEYALPDGFASMVPTTEWNRSTNLPLGGPVGPQVWQVLKSSDTVNPINYFYRVSNNVVRLHPTPTTAETLAYEYNSVLWVQPDGETTPTGAAPTASTDTLWFEAHLLTRGIKVRFLEAKGFDATAARNEYETALALAMGNDGAQGVLSLSGGGREPRPRLPETGWGS